MFFKICRRGSEKDPKRCEKSRAKIDGAANEETRSLDAEPSEWPMSYEALSSQQAFVQRLHDPRESWRENFV